MIKSTLNLDYYIYILYMYLYSMCSRWLWNFVSTKYAFHDEKYYLWTPCRGRTRAWEGWRMLAENIVVFSYRSIQDVKKDSATRFKHLKIVLGKVKNHENVIYSLACKSFVYLSICHLYRVPLTSRNIILLWTRGVTGKGIKIFSQVLPT